MLPILKMFKVEEIIRFVETMVQEYIIMSSAIYVFVDLHLADDRKIDLEEIICVTVLDQFNGLNPPYSQTV